MLLEERKPGIRPLREMLEAEGHTLTLETSPEGAVAGCARSHAPRLIVFNIEAPDMRLLRAIAELQRGCACPIVVFAQRSERGWLSGLVKAGASAVIVDGLAAQRLPAIVEIARARFAETQALQAELRRAMVVAIELRRIEQAKGVLMRRRDLQACRADALLREMAAAQRKRVAEVAESIINAEELLAQG